MTKKATIQTWTLVTGMATALVIVISQLFYFSAPQYTKTEVKTEQQQNQSEDASVISLPSSTLPSSATHVEFQQESFCLFEILFEEDEATETAFDLKLPVSKLFQTLFQSIISPNAP
ncbi:MAG TPA: hypothetical protein VGK59_09070 [Ohtaekwangia sp.]